MALRPKLLRLDLLVCLALGLSASACDGGDGDESESESTTTTTTSTTGDNACNDPMVATMECGSDCSFDPTTVDCMAACQNIADKCSDSACSASESCVGQNQDVATCAVACEATKGMTCTNIVFGCWDSQGATDNCEDVGVCVDAEIGGL